MANSRRNLASLVGGNVITVLNEGAGWPSRLRVQTSKGAIDVEAYMGPVLTSHRSRETFLPQ